MSLSFSQSVQQATSNETATTGNSGVAVVNLVEDEWVLSNQYYYYPEYYDRAESLVDENKNITLDSQHLNVVQEANAQIITFRMNRYYDGYDLLTTQITILYQNSKGNTDFAVPMNVYYNETHIKFSWLLDSKATQFAGEIKFEIQARGTNSRGDEYVWKSLPNGRFNIIQSLSYDGIEQPEETWVDIILQQISSSAVAAENSAIESKNWSTNASELVRTAMEVSEQTTQTSLETQELLDNLNVIIEEKILTDVTNLMPTDVDEKLPIVVDEKLPTVVDNKLPSLVDEKLPPLVDEKLPSVVDEKLPNVVDEKLPVEVSKVLPVDVDSKLPTLVDEKLPTVVDDKLSDVVDSKLGTVVDDKLPTVVDEKLPNEVATLLPNEVSVQLPIEVANKVEAEINEKLPIAIDEKLPTEVSNQILIKINEELPPEVDEKLPAVVDSKLGAVVENQLPAMVEDKLPDAMTNFYQKTDIDTFVSEINTSIATNKTQTDEEIGTLEQTVSDYKAILDEVKEDVDTFFAGADFSEEAKDVLKEIQEYINSDAELAAQLLNDISQNKTNISSLTTKTNTLTTNVSSLTTNVSSLSSEVDALATEVESQSSSNNAKFFNFDNYINKAGYTYVYTVSSSGLVYTETIKVTSSGSTYATRTNTSNSAGTQWTIKTVCSSLSISRTETWTKQSDGTWKGVFA